MIVPTKGISPDRSLLGIGADVLELLSRPMTVSEMWSKYRRRASRRDQSLVSFDWFVLALDMLYSISAISLTPEGRLTKNAVS